MAIPIGTAMLIGGGLSAASNTLAGILSNNAASDTNAEARRQFDLNMKFQRYQYEDQKRYQSYQNQVNMMRAAGLNPSLMFGSGASPAGSASLGGVGSTSQMTTPDFSYLGNVGSQVSNIMQGLSQVGLNNSVERVNDTQSSKNEVETQGQRIDNLYKDEFWKSSNYLRNSQSWLFDKQADIAKLQAQYDRESLGDRLFQQRWQAEETRARTEALLVTNSYLPQRCQQEIANLIQNQKLMVQQGLASVKQAMAAIMSATNQAKAWDAQYGGTPEDRGKFFNATLKVLESNSFKNVSTSNPLPTNKGRFADFDAWQHGDINKHNPFMRR